MANNIPEKTLNSEVIIEDIDCSIACNILLSLMSCCPTKELHYFPPSLGDLTELFMILLSATPFPTVFLLLCLAAYCRTSRSCLLLIMIFLEYFIVIALKEIIRDPRPNYLCNQEYGYPSGHSCFFSCLLFWFITEEICAPESYQFKYRLYLIPFGLIYPFLLYSRYYLNYHSLGQIIGGIVLGIFIGVGWYLLNVKFILCTDNILRQLMIKFNIENNLSDDMLYRDDGYILLDEYQSLIQKENELVDMKYKLKKAAKNYKNFEGLDDLTKNYQNILKNNINDDNVNSNYENNNNDVYGEENSDENINEIVDHCENNNIGKLNKFEKPKKD
jgi:membrane-associated phospholipid phosphatase